MTPLLPTLIADMLKAPAIAEVKRTRRKRRPEEQIEADSIRILKVFRKITANQLARLDGQDIRTAKKRLESWKAEGLVINEGLHWRLK